MSLESHGAEFKVSVFLTEKQRNILVNHPDEKLCIKEPMSVPAWGAFSYSRKSGPNSKAAFMKAMREFVESPAFQAATYDLENTFNINIQHTINLTMPTSYY